MIHRAVLFLALALGLGTQLTSATEVLVNNTEGKLCLYANLKVNFSVAYEAVGDKNATAVFSLPDAVLTNGSSCANSSSTLRLSFGQGHSWTMTFSKGVQNYQADSVTVDLNLADAAVFPNATSNETMSVTVNVNATNLSKADLGTCYSCNSQDVIREGGVSQTLWSVLIQAFVANGSKSQEITSCAADVPITPSPAPTNTSTAAPTTAVAPTTPIPTPTLPTPTTGKYHVTTGVNSTACLIADFGLSIGFKIQGQLQKMNLEPNGTNASGTCGVNSSQLVLSNPTATLVFTFVNETAKFRLHAVTVNITTGSGQQFYSENTNLSLWVASVGSSYMCNKEQSYNISESLALHTFDLHVQPFGVASGKFSTAHECSMDDTTALIPIIVGCALTGLILIVVVAYIIGRRKTYVGYQTL
ncbi:lysosome-associated membrane glycoprotein 2 isoform X1 [Gadus chalcogrammus]|uniref:lysosome-associated membrane glycoprotein 2 isoform X1 n=1 Tax=Gadus chalcogrammus TaxID=1042646 RepID=UPI0024C4BD3D|nr:lysosome-associated membrane glycoprotein 2 isoform X1 [Gadus chalcogrammus]